MSTPPASNHRFGYGRLPKDVVGLVHQMQWSLTFVSWASSLDKPPTAQQISDHFGVSRATGYRYRSAWEAAVDQSLIPAPAFMKIA